MWWPRPSAVGEYILFSDVPEVLITRNEKGTAEMAARFKPVDPIWIKHVVDSTRVTSAHEPKAEVV